MFNVLLKNLLDSIQKESLYHGTSKESGERILKVGFSLKDSTPSYPNQKSVGISFSKEITWAEEFISEKGYCFRVSILPHAKILDSSKTKILFNKHATYKQPIEDEEMEYYDKLYNEIAQWAIDNKYDMVDFSSVSHEKEVRVLNPDVIKIEDYTISEK